MRPLQQTRLVLVAALLVVGCTQPSGEGPLGTPATSTSTPPTTSTSPATTTTLGEPGDLHVRDCDQAIGPSDLDSADPSRDIWVYPVLFSNAATFHSVSSDLWGRVDDPNRFPAFKVPYVVAAGETVRVEVSSGDLEWATLHGGRANSDGHYFLGEGFGAVEYQACEDTDTFFNGGIIASRPGCLHLRVIHNEEEHEVRIGLALACS